MSARDQLDSQDGPHIKDSPLSLEVRYAQSQLSPSRRQLIRAILDNNEETFFLSSHEMARRYNVDASTIVRTVQALGYYRFADFAADLRQYFVTKITPYTEMKAAAQKNRTVADYIRQSVDKDVENINELRSSLDTDRITELAKLIHRSRCIMVVGIDFAASLAWSLTYGLVRQGFHAEAPVGSRGFVQHKVRLLTQKDMLVAISFGIGLRDTVEAAIQARKQNVPTFGITDGDMTPIARHCDAHLVASIARASYIDSYAAPISAINAILIACAHLHPKRTLALLRQADKDYGDVSRWYQEPPRRAKSESNGDNRSSRDGSKPIRKKR